MATTKVTYNGSEIISQDMTTPVAVTYGGSTIVSVSDGETKTLNCNGLYMNTNIVVGSKTLNCANSIMASNVVVEVETSKSYTLTLSGIGGYGWGKTASPANPDSTLYDGVYHSLNYNISSSNAVMRIDFTGYTTFNIYIRSYAEDRYDYSIASTLDAESYPTAYGSSTAKTSTRGNQQSGSAIENYTKVSYSNDGKSHHIYVVFIKDSSVNRNDDRGYVLIEK